MLNDYGKISVIIPVHNVEQYIEKCLTSVINQTYENLEIIIINYGSTDNSESIIKRIIKDDNRCLYTSRKNKDIGKARNEGLSKASGDYIAWIDVDGYLELNMYASLINDMVNNNSDMVICNSLIFHEDGKSMEMNSNHFFGTTIIDVQENIDMLLQYLPAALELKISKRSIYENISFNYNVEVDDSIIPLILKKIKKISFVNESLYKQFASKSDNHMSLNNFKSFKEKLKVYIQCYNNYEILTSSKEILMTKHDNWFIWYMNQSFSFRFRTLFFQRFLKKQRDTLDMVVNSKVNYEFVNTRNSFRFKFKRKVKKILTQKYRDETNMIKKARLSRPPNDYIQMIKEEVSGFKNVDKIEPLQSYCGGEKIFRISRENETYLLKITSHTNGSLKEYFNKLNNIQSSYIMKPKPIAFGDFRNGEKYYILTYVMQEADLLEKFFKRENNPSIHEKIGYAIGEFIRNEMEDCPNIKTHKSVKDDLLRSIDVISRNIKNEKIEFISHYIGENLEKFDTVKVYYNKKHVIHGDLHSGNILIDNHLNVGIIDFPVIPQNEYSIWDLSALLRSGIFCKRFSYIKGILSGLVENDDMLPNLFDVSKFIMAHILLMNLSRDFKRGKSPARLMQDRSKEINRTISYINLKLDDLNNLR